MNEQIKPVEPTEPVTQDSGHGDPPPKHPPSDLTTGEPVDVESDK